MLQTTYCRVSRLALDCASSLAKAVLIILQAQNTSWMALSQAAIAGNTCVVYILPLQALAERPHFEEVCRRWKWSVANVTSQDVYYCYWKNFCPMPEATLITAATVSRLPAPSVFSMVLRFVCKS